MLGREKGFKLVMSWWKKATEKTRPLGRAATPAILTESLRTTTVVGSFRVCSTVEDFPIESTMLLKLY